MAQLYNNQNVECVYKNKCEGTVQMGDNLLGDVGTKRYNNNLGTKEA